MYGHQDTRSRGSMSTEAKLNVEAGRLAGLYQDELGAYSLITHMYSSSSAVLEINSMTITINVRHQLINAYSELRYIQYLQQKYEWKNKTVKYIAWKCLNLGLQRIDREVMLVKICNGLLPTATTLLKWKWQNHDNCCLCGQSETRDHMIPYAETTRRQWRIKTISAIRKRMKQMNTQYKLENTLACTTSKWFKTGYVSLYKYPENFHDAIWRQGTIGWRQIFNNRISRHWLGHQGNTKTLQGRLRMNYIWGASIVETCLRMMIELWEMRKEEVYEKEEVTKQQKRKEKAATSVRKLHNLQEITHPSNVKLFYEDVEKEIETGTAATVHFLVH